MNFILNYDSDESKHEFIYKRNLVCESNGTVSNVFVDSETYNI